MLIMRGYPDITILVTSVLWLFIISVVRRRPLGRCSRDQSLVINAAFGMKVDKVVNLIVDMEVDMVAK